MFYIENNVYVTLISNCVFMCACLALSKGQIAIELKEIDKFTRIEKSEWH